MAKAKAKKRSDMENELMNHVDIIEDDKVKSYIREAKTAKEAAKRLRQQNTPKLNALAGMISDEDQEESEDEDVVMETVKDRIKSKTSVAKAGKKITAKTIKK